MCGISAFMSHGSSNRSPEETKQVVDELESSLDIIAHRGPDARGTWYSENHQVGLGHVRLSILDLSPTGNQPFHDSHPPAAPTISAVVNGELYNHEYYRDLLSPEFHFVGTSDCEIVIALYKHYGLSFLEHLRGEFAFVLWDESKKRLIAGRDRYGIKSLYYTWHDGKLLVATEMKSFLKFGKGMEWGVRELREQSWRVGSETYFKGIYRVLPGHYLVARPGEQEYQVPYWDVEYPDKSIPDSRSATELTENVRTRLLEATRIRLKADVPVAVYLSGGIDSSSVAGMVAHLMKQGHHLGSESSTVPSKMKCFTVQFDEDTGADESAVAHRTAAWLGVDIHMVKMDEEALVARFEDTVWNAEVPLPDLNGMGRYALAEAVHKQGIKVVITGEGSDEHFGGYDAFRADWLSEADHSWAAQEEQLSASDRDEALQTAVAASKRGIFGDFTPEIPASSERMMNHGYVLASIARVGSLPFAEWTRHAHGDTAPETALVECLDGRVRENIRKRWHPFHAAEYMFVKTFMPHYILRYNGDNVDMRHQVESRCPFLDHHLTEYVNNIPPALKIQYHHGTKSWREKHILREAVKPFVTDEIYNMSKKAYMGPRKFWVGGPLWQKVTELVTKENVQELGFVDWQAAEEAVKRAFEEQDALSLRRAITVAQFVVLGKGFGVKKAVPGQ
ncbi:Amidase [Colletotrichum fructicola]|uniref:Amidase chyE n=2 Tax=Colletotrichum fructicola (strain Nara gc5) TaxID=1213859 RepID=A0A7J6J8R5_COLFN|nr:Amidase [Colletotrichum fructicola]KAE9569368.1 Amidase [Colletotrichum fructicola]KAF4421495.1 Amidase chyE [Colletotrichum fructicola]KAF4484938.1 Amidase chyE [Colletotrichum fructicola Nara gc5]KAF4885028.1 Amidase chyE [Colletotrichum fructicola]